MAINGLLLSQLIRPNFDLLTTSSNCRVYIVRPSLDTGTSYQIYTIVWTCQILHFLPQSDHSEVFFLSPFPNNGRYTAFSISYTMQNFYIIFSVCFIPYWIFIFLSIPACAHPTGILIFSLLDFYLLLRFTLTNFHMFFFLGSTCFY